MGSPKCPWRPSVEARRAFSLFTQLTLLLVISSNVCAQTKLGGDPDSEELLGKELNDWKQRSTGTTRRLAAGCGGSVEASLSGSARLNFVNLTIANHSVVQLVTLPRAFRVRFDRGQAEPLEPVDALNPEFEQIQPNETLHLTLRFADKARFARAERLELEVPLDRAMAQNCTIQVVFERDRTQPRDRASYEKWTRLSVDFFGASRLPGHGAIHGIAGDSRGNWGLAFSYFFTRHLGLGMDIELESFGSTGVRAVMGGRSFRRTPEITGTVWALEAPIRFELGPLSIVYRPALGTEVFELSSGQQGDPKQTAVLWALQHHLRLQLSFLSLSDGTLFAIGPDLLHRFLPYGHLGAADVSGHVFAGGLALVVGGG